MPALTPSTQQTLQKLAKRHGFSTNAVLHMFDAIVNGNGGMAQFRHPEFGGSGQWMRGGMLMLSDMFDHALKARVAALCDELAALAASEPNLLRSGSFQSQQQGDGSPLAARADWWPAPLSQPNATGAQNGVRYAYFAGPRRLAIERDGQVTVYDTLDHRIGGVSQQQSSGSSLVFTSQHGGIDLARLPVVSGSAHEAPAVTPTAAAASRDAPSHDVFTMIDKLAALHAKGVLNDEEFAVKKTELLARL